MKPLILNFIIANPLQHLTHLLECLHFNPYYDTSFSFLSLCVYSMCINNLSSKMEWREGERERERENNSNNNNNKNHTTHSLYIPNFFLSVE